jgi:hypothetical protein
VCSPSAPFIRALQLFYSKLPADIASKTVILVDPMLGTGGSSTQAISVQCGARLAPSDSIAGAFVARCLPPRPPREESAFLPGPVALECAVMPAAVRALPVATRLPLAVSFYVAPPPTGSRPSFPLPPYRPPSPRALPRSW